MNRKKLFSLAVLYSITTLVYAANTEVTPTIVARSQGRDAMRKLVGVSGQVHKYDAGRYVNLTVMPEYTETFRDNKIARCLFGNDVDSCGNIKIQGSDVEDRCENAWLADYFYLPPDYNSHFTIEPRIRNFLVDLDVYVGLDDMVEGMYLRASGPINWTEWDLRFNEPCDLETTGSYRAGYFDREAMQNNQLLQSFGDYAQGGRPLNRTDQANANIACAAQFMPLQYATIDSCKHSRTGFADLRLELGYNVLQEEDYHFGINFQLAAPTGSKSEAFRAFDSTVGNRNHWEVGGGLTGHYNFWHGDCVGEQAGIYFDLSLTHMNKAREQRTFDLCGRPNSRYMLAMQLGRPVANLIAGDDAVTPVAQFTGLYSPVANLTTLNVNVSVPVQADLAIMLNYSREKWGVDIGYNLWARSCENFGRARELAQCCPSLCDGSKDVWALKGDANTYGFAAGETGSIAANQAIPLSATQCGATIHGGTNASTESNTTDCPGISTLQNCGVDNAQNAAVGSVNLLHSPNIADTAGNIAKTSLEPKFINCCDINLQRTKGISHKVFADFNYNFEARDSWVPYVSVGGFAEFGKTSDCGVCDITINCDQDCDTSSCGQACCTGCLDCAVSQWGIFVKGGVNFQ